MNWQTVYIYNLTTKTYPEHSLVNVVTTVLVSIFAYTC